MLKAIELIMVITLLTFAFFAGITYSGSIKNHVSWIFEIQESDAELSKISSKPSRKTLENNTENPLPHTTDNNPHSQTVK